MRLRVIAVEPLGAGRWGATFATRFGVGRAVWAPSLEPRVDAEHDAELDVDGLLELGKNARLLAEAANGIDHEGDALVLRGAIETIDEDGMLVLRLARDCIVMIEARPGEVAVGAVVELRVPWRSAQVWPFGS